MIGSGGSRWIRWYDTYLFKNNLWKSKRRTKNVASKSRDENFFMTKISGTLAKGKEILGHQNTIKKIYAEVTAEKKTPTS